QVRERPVREQRRVELRVGFLDMITTLGGLRRDVRAEASRDHRLRIEASLEIAIFDANGESQWTAWQIEQAPGHVSREIPTLLLAGILLDEADEVEHLVSNCASAAEDIEGGASGRGGAGCNRSERYSQIVGIDVAMHRLLGLVAPIAAVDVPVP